MTTAEVIDLIKDAGYGMLATIEDGKPRNRPMMPHLDDDGNMLLAVLGHSRTIAQIKANPHVEFCFVDRKMNFARISGKASISDDPEKKEKVWNYVPMLRQYFTALDDPNFVLLEINTESVEAMTPRQQKPDVLSLKS